MEKLRVLHVVPSFHTGGAEKLVVDFFKHYDQTNFHLAALCLSPKTKENIYEKELEKIGAQVLYLEEGSQKDLRRFYTSLRVIGKFRPQVVHTHLDAMRHILPATVLNKVPVRLHTVHNMAEKEFESPSKFKIQKIAYKYFNFIPVAISQTVKESVEELYQLKEIPLIYNGIDTTQYDQRNLPSQSQEELIQMIHIGRFVEQKNHDLLLDAFKIVAAKLPNVCLKLVGDGPLKDEMRRKVAALNLDKRVEFLGIRNDVPKLLGESHVFALSSKWEGFGLVVVEAMASGLPVVSTNLPPIAELMEDQVNGFLVPSDNPQKLAERMIRLSTDRKLGTEIGRQNIMLAKKFDIRITQRSYEALYRRMSERKIL